MHLGYVYALDHTKKTSEKLLVDALHFAPIVEELLEEKIDWSKLRSTAFNYYVAGDSMLGVNALLEHYAHIDNVYHSMKDDAAIHYLGTNPERLHQEPTNHSSELYDKNIVAIIPTQEYAIELHTLRTKIVRKIVTSNIKTCLSHKVIDVRRTSQGFETTCLYQEKEIKIKSDIVINAAWAGKRAIDQMVNIIDDDIWSLRIKMGLVLPFEKASEIKSFTMVQGSYGDFVHYPNDKSVYFSWYDHCMVHQTTATSLSGAWKQIYTNKNLQAKFKNNIECTRDKLVDLFPEFKSTNIHSVKIGPILARDYKSINDPVSGLHQRSDAPILIDDGYYSINTGKFTSAPHNSRKLVALL